MANARLTQAPLVVAADGDGPARLTQAPVYVLATIASGALLTQAPLVVLADGAGDARLTQAPLLVLGSDEVIPPTPPDSGACVGIDAGPFAVVVTPCPCP